MARQCNDVDHDDTMVKIMVITLETMEKITKSEDTELKSVLPLSRLDWLGSS